MFKNILNKNIFRLYSTKNHIINSKQFSRIQIETLLQNSQDIMDNINYFQNRLQGHIMASMFFEPSTRTSSSFQCAMMRLGGNILPFSAIDSSIKKKESLLDTLKTVEQYTDITVFRHPESNILDNIVDKLENPIINAGDGSNEHPTQGLLDILTIQQELDLNNLDNLNITFVGDLKHGRTVHSLTNLLLNYNNLTFNLVSPLSLKLPKKIKKIIEKSNSKYNEYDIYDDVISETNVLYMTRIQKERFETLTDYNLVSNTYELKRSDLPLDYKDFIIMHPLPRVNEINIDVDYHPSAKYFNQVKYGMYMRMALLCYSLQI